MNNYNDSHNSLSTLYSSVLRGNEIEFQYDNKYYYILPYYIKNEVVGVCFGEAYTDNEIVCYSESELYNAQVGKYNLGEIFAKIKIVWKNF